MRRGLLPGHRGDGPVAGPDRPVAAWRVGRGRTPGGDQVGGDHRRLGVARLEHLGGTACSSATSPIGASRAAVTEEVVHERPRPGPRRPLDDAQAGGPGQRRVDRGGSGDGVAWR